MAKVDPEALMREADELARKAGMMPAEPENPDTPQDPDPSPEPHSDTDEEYQSDDANDEGDRGDPNQSDDEEFVPVERYKNAQAAMTKAQQEASALRRQVEDLRAENERLRAGGESDSNPRDAGEAEAEIEALMEEYPEIAGPILKKLKALETTVQSDRASAEQRKKQDATEAHLSAIREKHPDLDQIVEDPDFDGWVARQTPTWQRVAQQGSAEEVIELLDRYKDAMGLNETPQRESAVERARKVAEPKLPRSRKPDQNARKKVWSRKEIAAMSLSEYEAQREEIDRAYIEGRVR